MSELTERVEQVVDGESAAELLKDELSPATVRALATRAEEIRYKDPKASFEIASAALEAQKGLSTELRRPRLVALTWAIYGSSCRGLARFDEAELALTRAARAMPKADTQGRSDIALRLAVLRADEKKEVEARQLTEVVLQWSRESGGRRYGEELIAAAGIVIRFNDFRSATYYLEEALTLLPENGDRFHLAAIYNLARCRFELASTSQELYQAGALVRKAAWLAEPGSLYELRLIWMNGNLHRRLGRYDESLEALEQVRTEIDQRGDGFDRALLLLDLAELHLERNDPQSARQVALSSFGILTALRNQPDAFRAIKILHRSAMELALDLPTVHSVRSALLDARS